MICAQQGSWHRTDTGTSVVNAGRLGSSYGVHVRKERTCQFCPGDMGPAEGHLEWEQLQRHLLGKDAPEILLSFLDTAQVFQTEAF